MPLLFVQFVSESIHQMTMAIPNTNLLPLCVQEVNASDDNVNLLMGICHPCVFRE